MTEEELKQEAEKSLDKRLGTYAYIRKQDCYTNYVDGYIDSAEPREKRIAELETRCNELFLQTCEQAEKIKELKEYNKYLKRKRQGGIQKQYNKVAIIKQQDNQLTKAKEIIKNLMVFAEMDDREYEKKYKEAEQFLNSEVEK